MTSIVGTVDKEGGAIFVVPDDRRFISDVFVPKKAAFGARHGQKVVVRITQYPRDNRDNPEGEVVQVLGYPDDKDVDMLSVALSMGVRSFRRKLRLALQSCRQKFRKRILQTDATFATKRYLPLTATTPRTLTTRCPLR